MVELARPIITSTHQREHLARVRIQRHQRHLRIHNVRLVARLHPPRMQPLHLRVDDLHLFVDRLRGCSLQFRIEGRVNPQPLLVVIGVTQRLRQLLPHQVDK